VPSGGAAAALTAGASGEDATDLQQHRLQQSPTHSPPQHQMDITALTEPPNSKPPTKSTAAGNEPKGDVFRYQYHCCPPLLCPHQRTLLILCRLALRSQGHVHPAALPLPRSGSTSWLDPCPGRSLPRSDRDPRPYPPRPNSRHPFTPDEDAFEYGDGNCHGPEQLGKHLQLVW
jgi:hypothetical protein